MYNFAISYKVFDAVSSINICELSKLSQRELRPVFPCLVRMAMVASGDTTPKCTKNRGDLLTILVGFEEINPLVSLLSIDFQDLEAEIKEELGARRKAAQSDNSFLHASAGTALEFERSDYARRMNLVLHELSIINLQLEYHKNSAEFFIKHSDLFDNLVYIPDICDVITIALCEMSSLITMQELVQILLHVKNGPIMICWIASNFPDHFNDICLNLLMNSDRIEDENGGSLIRMKTLTRLCKMNPPGAYFVRSKCVELTKLAPLTITLTLLFPGCFWGTNGSSFLQRGGDIVPFVSGVLLGTDQQVRNWFNIFLRSRPKIKENNTTLQLLRDELTYHLKSMVKFTVGKSVPNNYVVYCSVLLKLYCALRGIAGIKFQDEEVGLLIMLVTTKPPATIEGARLVSIAVCMLFACPSLIGQPDNETKSIHWLKWLSGADSPFFGKPTDVTTSVSEMLLLLAIHLHSNQLSAISDLVSSTLGMKVSMRAHNMGRIKTIFIQEVFNEQVVTSRAIKVLVTPNLNSNITGFLPIHCIHQLMKSRAFTKHKVNVKDWVYKQICASSSPLHPLLPSLVEVYVNSMLSGVVRIPYESISNEPITEDEIMNVFQESSVIDGGSMKKNIMPQLLLLYYVLLYEDIRLTNSPNMNPYHRHSVKSYSTEFLAEFPIRYLLQQAQKDQQNYAGLFPSLLRLLLTHFPHLALVEDWIDDEELSLVPMTRKTISETSLINGLNKMSINSSQASRILYGLLGMPIAQIWPLAPIFVQYLRSALDDDVPRYIQELYKKVWLKYNTLLPKNLWMLTIDHMLHENSKLPENTKKRRENTIDPLHVLRCDNRVFRCPPILSIMLRVLQSTLAASRSQLGRHLLDKSYSAHVLNALQQGSLPSEMDREELKTALLLTQESAAIQILMEACLENDNDKTSISKIWTRREVCCIICSFLHQKFISDTSLAKLVHFQGYPRKLLPIMVQGIPSLHITVDYVPEMIAQPCLEKQVFAVDLISHLSLQYAVPHSMMVARLVINTLATLLTVIPASTRIRIFMPALPALVRICESFPTMIEEVILLLMQLGKICVSELALANGVASSHMINRIRDTCRQTQYFDSSSLTLSNDHFCQVIEETFTTVIKRAVLKTSIY